MSQTLQKISEGPRGGELFIVDNSDESWKVLKYLQEWTDVARSFDVATGYFEIGSLLDLDGRWQNLEGMRILMGDEVSHRTKKSLLDGVTAKLRERLDSSLESAKEKNDFLHGAAAIVDALRTGKIACRVYAQRKFHAKAYITHPKSAVLGSVALVGSSNFTTPGLTQNVELNIQVRAPGDVTQLQEWYERHWQDSEDITPEVLKVIERHIREYLPFDVYAKALRELFLHHDTTDAVWERTKSVMYPILDRYQQEGYHSLLKIARAHNGALLCDGVGLGKTFVGLMLIERLVMHEKKRVLLLVPKSARATVWENAVRRYMPHLLNGFLPFKIFNHTDLMRGEAPDGRDFQAEFDQMREQADVVIIDEAHHFRNRGLSKESGGSRYWRLYDVIADKALFLLTATPVNNRLTDFQHLIELFSRIDNPAAFATTLGIHNLPAHFQRLEKTLERIASGLGMGELFENLKDDPAQQFFDDKLFRELVVQRSRAYAVASQKQQGGKSAVFPVREDPIVAKYSVKKTYGHLLGVVESAFSKPEQLFSLAVYYPLAKWKGDPTQLEAFDINRQKQLVRLIRIQFLKRFESSILAFESSCQTLLQKLLAFLEKNSVTEGEKKRLVRWKAQNAEMLAHIAQRRARFEDEADSEEASAEGLADEFLEEFEVVDRDNYKVDEIIDETYADLEQLVDFLEELKPLDTSHDDKLRSLIKLLKSDPVLKKHKVLIFTEYMTTARYLRDQLHAAGIVGVDEVDSATKTERSDVIRRFAPYYNGKTSAILAEEKQTEIRVLISTDVLSEGLNLQDATRLINYDLHWNPVRLMQRIGRVDRRLNPEVEKLIVADHPEQAKLRGKVTYWNFLPPDDLDLLLRLYSRVSNKVLRISKVFGIEGRKLLRKEDDYADLKDFVHKYEGEMKPIEELDLEYQKLLADNPGLDERLNGLPGRVFSGRAHIKPGTRAVFLCYSLPAEDRSAAATHNEASRWTEAAGKTAWYLVDVSSGTVMDQPEEIAAFIRSAPDTPRRAEMPTADLREIRLMVEKKIKNDYLKQVQAPLGVKPSLKCWMELC
jgi:superfamily II DNA or RNA helicase